MKLPTFARARSASSLSSTTHPPSNQASRYLCFSLTKSSRSKQGNSQLFSNVSASSPAAISCPHVDTAAPSEVTGNDGNSVSLRSASASLQRLPSKTMQELKQVFAQFDANHDGKISVNELCAVLRSLGVEATREDAELMVKEVDANGDGFIDLQEFMELHGGDHVQVMAQDELRATFEIFDLNKDGHITAQELHAVLTNLGDDGHTSLEDCNRMIRNVDRKGVGHVDLDDFKLMMMHA